MTTNEFDLEDILAEFKAEQKKAPAAAKVPQPAVAKRTVQRSAPNAEVKKGATAPATEKIERNPVTGEAHEMAIKPSMANKNMLAPEKKSVKRKSSIAKPVLIVLFTLCMLWSSVNIHPMGVVVAAKPAATPASVETPAIEEPNPVAETSVEEEQIENVQEVMPEQTPEPTPESTPEPIHYTLPEDMLVAPAPNSACYGAVNVDNATEVLTVIEMAREYGLVGEDEAVVFNPDVEFYRGIYSDDIRYYLDETILVILWKEVIDGKSCTLTEVKIADGSQLRRKLADDAFGSYNTYNASTLAMSTNAVVAMNADYYAFRDFGIVVYGRDLKRFNTNNYTGMYSKYNCVDTLFITAGGDFLYKNLLEENNEDSIRQFVAENDIVFSLAFGPVLVRDGVAQECTWYPVGEVNESYSRAGIGQVDKLHYLWMSVNHGDAPAHWTVTEFARHFAEKNVITAYCLDGGQTGEVVFQNEPYNHIDFGAERAVSDIIYFATAIPEEGEKS